MEDFYEKLKVNALNKANKINHLVDEISIGPNANKKLNSSPKLIKPVEEIKVEGSSDTDIENSMPTKEFWKILELERQGELQSVLRSRINIFEQFDKAQKEQCKQTWVKTQQAFIEDMKKQELIILQATQQYDMKLSSQHAMQTLQTKNAILRLKQKQEQLKEKEKQKQILIENINRIKANQQKFSLEYQQILGILKSCSDNEKLKNSTRVDLTLLQKLPIEIEQIVQRCKSENISNITDKDVHQSQEVVTKIIDFKNTFKSIVDDINVNKKETEKLRQESDKTDKIISNQNLQVNTNTSQKVPLNDTNDVSNNQLNLKSSKTNFVSNLSKLTKFISVTDLHVYVEVLEFFENYKKTFAQLQNDSALKTFKFDLKKAINIPVNSLSGVNPEHILDKYQKLHKLLLGQDITVGGKEVNASKHPEGIAFCTDLLAKQFVLQGDLMVSSNPESAFCYASVILSLWNDFPDFGKLLLAYFYKSCPYLVPYYIPRQVGESDEEFYKKLGYQYIDSQVEKQDKFLKRMTGILNLYFAILISKPKKSQTSSPCNLKYGWKWLTSLLKLEPQIDITATSLHVFLEVVGFEMEARYGKMFQKVLNIIIKVFLPKCQQIKCTGGAVTRLELLLTHYMEKNKFDRPNGYVEYPYW